MEQWSLKKGDPWSLEQPATKKRCLGLNKRKRKSLESGDAQEDWGDDSLELTQAELEEMDMMMSQATQPDKPTEGTSMSKPTSKKTETASSSASLMKPPRAAGPIRKSTSTSSDSSSLSHQPSSLSSRLSNSSSASLSSHSSSNGIVEGSSNLDQSAQAKMKDEMQKAQEEKYRAEGEVKFLRQTLRKQETEMEKLRAERDEFSDLQKQAHTEKEHQLQLQVDSLKSQAHFTQKEMEDQIQTLTQKLKTLQQQTQQQTASVSLSPKQPSPRKVAVRPSPPSKARLLQQQRQKGEELTSSQQQSFPTRMSFMEEINPATSGASPTVKTAQVSNRASQTETVKPKDGEQLHDNKQSTSVKSTLQPVSQRRQRLVMDDCKSSLYQLPGNQIVSHLLQTNGSGSIRNSFERQHQSWDPGLTDLLQPLSTPSTLAALTYRRAQESANLSPIKPKKILSNAGSYTVVSRVHFRLAIEGLTRLMEISSSSTDQIKTPQNNNKPDSTAAMPNKETEEATQNSSNQTSGRSSIFSSAEEKVLDKEKASAASLLLPLLSDYLEHYLNIVQSGAKRAVSRRSSGVPAPDLQRSTSSVEQTQAGSLSSSSLDSLSSLVLDLLQDGRVYAASMEQQALTALQALHALVLLCPSLAEIVLRPLAHDSQTKLLGKTRGPGIGRSSSSNTSNTSDDVVYLPSAPKKRTSGTEADDEYSTTSSEPRVVVGKVPGRHKSHHTATDNVDIFHVLVKLAGQDLEDACSNSLVVQEALKVLTAVCEQCKKDQIEKFHLVVTQGLFSGCFRQTRSIPVVICAQRLVKAMARSEKLLRQICTKSEHCPLYLMYRACSREYKGKDQELFTKMYKEHILSVAAMICRNPNNLSCLLNAACACSNELTVSVVQAMDGLYCQLISPSPDPPTTPATINNFQSLSKHTQRQRLQEMLPGVTLLLKLVQADHQFVQHRARARLQYVRLLSDLAARMKESSEDWEMQLLALEELCDFESDLTDSSQEADSEGGPMDTT